jgi:hypothetical protein
MQMKSFTSILASLVIAGMAAAVHGAEPVEVPITGKVLVPETKRLGINLCGDNYWDCTMLKTRAAENFEGVRYRMMTWGPQMD